MKYIFTFLLLIGIYNSSWAQQVIPSEDKTAALKACEKKASYLPEKFQQEMLTSCRCVVEHTDFDKVSELKSFDDAQLLQTLYQEIDSACLLTQNHVANNNLLD